MQAIKEIWWSRVEICDGSNTIGDNIPFYVQCGRVNVNTYKEWYINAWTDNWTSDRAPTPRWCLHQRTRVWWLSMMDKSALVNIIKTLIITWEIYVCQAIFCIFHSISILLGNDRYSIVTRVGSKQKWMTQTCLMIFTTIFYIRPVTRQLKKETGVVWIHLSCISPLRCASRQSTFLSPRLNPSLCLVNKWPTRRAHSELPFWLWRFATIGNEQQRLVLLNWNQGHSSMCTVTGSSVVQQHASLT